MKNNTKTQVILFIAAMPVVMWMALIAAGAYSPRFKAVCIFGDIAAAMNKPTEITINEYSLKAVLVFLFLYVMEIGVYFSSRENRRPGEEHGSAKWGSVFEAARRYGYI